MQFKFESSQQYQLDAISAVADLFEGQARTDAPQNLVLGEGVPVAGNRLDLDDAALLHNLQTVQIRGGLAPDGELQFIEGKIERKETRQKKIEIPVRFPNFSIEMETGTGKTYVYLRTALELFRRYGLRKFIIVVPSVAVREGVLTTLRQTDKHFALLFDNTPYKFSVYNSANLSSVSAFARSGNVEFLVMTIDSFSKVDLNVIYRDADRLQGETPLHLLQAARPILLLDEPQNMESEKRVAALAALNPLLALRYSATHRNSYNLVHRLSPFDAYRQDLVKRIEVASVLQDNDFNHAFVRVDGITSVKNTITARISLHQLLLDGTIKEKTHTFRPGANLREKANRPDYDGYVIEEINPGGGFVRFENNLELGIGSAHGVAKEQIFRAQIRYTIGEHLRKQNRLREKGIKVLSLFFIDRVANYRTEEGQPGPLAQMFAEAFDEMKNEPNFKEFWGDKSAEDVQAAYFAQKRKSKEEIVFEDSINGKAKKDEAAYDLIMRDKEKLLSFDEPVAFLFSHSALREGWDNPNVFQICTLNQTTSDMKKRQEVGRGVRLARDAKGDLVREEKVNVLTVIANQSYQAYVETLQEEIESEYGPDAKAPPVTKATRDKAIARLRPDVELDSEFSDLWNDIKRKTRYTVHLDTEQLVKEVVAALDQIEISPPRVSATKALLEVKAEDEFLTQQLSNPKTVVDLSGGLPQTDLIATMLHLLEFTTPRMCLSRATLLQILKGIANLDAALANPQEFASKAVAEIKVKLAAHLIGGIQYHETGEWFDMTIFDGEVEGLKDKMIRSPKGLYDYLVYDSQTECKFVEDLEKRKDVRRYVKLPRLFLVPTPIGDYNPDWAVIADDTNEFGEETGRQLNLVRETKSTLAPGKLRPGEEQKIKCGKKHFTDALGVNFKKITQASELLP